MAAITYDAYEAFEHGNGNYSVVLVHTVSGARFTSSPVVCGRQAHAHATRAGQRNMVFLGVRKMSGGVEVETEFLDECDRSDSEHVWTHRFSLPK